ncbi:hypothetical protein [Actinomyces ruminicola]|uniref:hypothetical protein n=1 Tax=Actinomyces ruminicola TaxID=332524 RepID=UPI00115FFDCA|nr:hypothetical protein [Actinomyces ruminicola]
MNAEQPLTPEQLDAHHEVIHAAKHLLSLSPSAVPEDSRTKLPTTPNDILRSVASPMDRTKPRTPDIDRTQDAVYEASLALIRSLARAEHDDEQIERQRYILHTALEDYRIAVDRAPKQK